MQVIPALSTQLLDSPRTSVLAILGWRVGNGRPVLEELPEPVVRIRLDAR